MTAFHLAQMNIARLAAPLDDPRLADFVAALDSVNALADASPGFVWRLQSDSGNTTAPAPFLHFPPARPNSHRAGGTMATEAPTIPNTKTASAAAPAARKHLLIPGSAMASLTARAESMRPSPWYTVWEQAILQPSLATFEGLAANPAARPERALKWMLAGAALGWGLPAMASLLRTSAPLFTVIFAYLALVALTVVTFVAATAAAHALADQLDAPGEFGGLAFVCASFAAPLTVAAGLLVSGPAPLRLLLLPAAIYALALTVQAARAVYGLGWRPALIVAVPSVVLLALLPLAAVAGAWAGLVGW